MYIGVDVGGTSIVTGLVSNEGSVLDSNSFSTEVSLGSKKIIARIAKSIKDLMNSNDVDSSEISSVGIGIPGIVDSRGVILECVNLKWKNVDIKRQLENILKLKVYVQNDATVAAIAEASLGSLKGEDTAVLLTLGTGVGGGLIVNGKIYSGNNGLASELGHMVVGENFYDCNCGRNGCLETYSSATGVTKYAAKIIGEGDILKRNSKFAKDFAGKGTSITCRDVFDYAKSGDELAKETVDRMVKYLVRAIVNLIITLDIEKVSIGGGVAAAGLYLVNLIEEELNRERIFRSIKGPSVVLATMGNNAGVVGAALIETFI